MLVKILLSTVLKSVNFIVSLFCTIFKYRVIITFVFLTFEHEKLFESHLSVNASLVKISCQNIIFKNDLNNFSAFLENFNSFGEFKVCLKAPFSATLCYVQATHMNFDESQLADFSMMRGFTGRHLRPDFHFSLNVNVNVTVDSYINSTSRETILRNFLQQWIDLNIFRIMKLKSTSKVAFSEANSQILLILYSFSMYF